MRAITTQESIVLGMLFNKAIDITIAKGKSVTGPGEDDFVMLISELHETYKKCGNHIYPDKKQSQQVEQKKQFSFN